MPTMPLRSGNQQQKHCICLIVQFSGWLILQQCPIYVWLKEGGTWAPDWGWLLPEFSFLQRVTIEPSVPYCSMTYFQYPGEYSILVYLFNFRPPASVSCLIYRYIFFRHVHKRATCSPTKISVPFICIHGHSLGCRSKYLWGGRSHLHIEWWKCNACAKCGWY